MWLAARMLTSRWGKSSRSHANGNCLEARWRKASRSQINGNCLEAMFQPSSYSNSANCLEAAWHKSSRSDVHGCTEAALQGGTVLVRDSKLDSASPVLTFSPADWQEFLEGIKASNLSAV
jgi:hypothetical protein